MQNITLNKYQNKEINNKDDTLSFRDADISNLHSDITNLNDVYNCVLSVSEVSEILKNKIENSFSSIQIRGEISGLKIATSGHMYFNLKDVKSVLSAICWKGSKLEFKLEDGLEIICSGNMTTYSGRSLYQFIVRTAKISGKGALLALFEKRRQKFIALGLFDKEKKLPIPFLPKVIGIITSIHGAVIKDILHRLSDRFPTHVIIWDTPVQGKDATIRVSEAIKGFNNLPPNFPKIDLLIIARGGGSIEDLWSFNEEEILYAIAESRIPVISAIGHETDITLSDFVADMRAPTPTAAAEFAVPVLKDLVTQSIKQSEIIKLNILNLIKIKKSTLSSIEMRFTKIVQMITNKFILLEGIKMRLKSSLKHLLEIKLHKMHMLKSTTLVDKMQSNLHMKKQLLDMIIKSINIATKNYYRLHKQKLVHSDKLLSSYSYKNVLRRGFAVIRDIEHKNIIPSADLLTNGQQIILEFFDGQKIVQIIK